jgi:PAS domain-containing protein
MFSAVNMEAPELFMLEGKPGELRAACTACARIFHAYIRTTEGEARRLLSRGFNVHCRLRHQIVLKASFGDSGVEQLFRDLLLPAYVFERSSHKVIAANDHFKQLMGYTDPDPNLSLEDLRAPESLPSVDDSLRRNTGKGLVKRRYRTRDGRMLTVHLKYQDINLRQNDAVIPDACFVVLTAVKAA